jgi:flavin-binding protein dodecin
MAQCIIETAGYRRVDFEHRKIGITWIVATFLTLMGRLLMAEAVYKVIELVGTSTESWEKATAAAINRASKTLRDLRVAEVVKLDVQLKNGKVEAYRSRISVSFKYESAK